MKAMIFAAGIGSRLKPFTDSHPKALAPVAGRPAIEHAIRHISSETGITDFVVNIHHFPEQIREWAAGAPIPDVTIRFSDESDLLLDTGGGLLKALPLLESGDDDLVIVHNADIVSDFPIKSMVERMRFTDADAVLLTSGRNSSRQLLFKPDGTLAGWRNNTTGETKPADIDVTGLTPLAFGGVHIIRLSRIAPLLKEFAAEAGNIFSVTPFYLSIMHAAKILAFTPSSPFRWFDIGTPAKLEAATAAFQS
ncbi:MAG: sugar phosphate nucleotidyltransferase [Muribaculaceae bacterium]|nr:sugar phosphate nucleotidyltransferase [Muribaculaceae bacterium]